MVPVKMKKAQSFGPDFVVSSIVFILILSMLHIHVQSIYERIEKQNDLIFYESLVSTTDLLMLYHGYPRNWNSNNVEVLGLAERPNKLNETKVIRFMNDISNENVSKLLNIEGMSFYFLIKNKTSVIMEKNNTGWEKIREDSDNIYIINRNAVMNEKQIEIDFLFGD